MIAAPAVIKLLGKRGFSVYCGVPCSYLTPLIDRLNDDKKAAYYPASNEGQAVAFASGAVLSGRKSVVMMQNSGLGNAVNPLTSLNAIFKIPLLLIITLRGEPGTQDEPQHELMGRITGRMLEVMGIPWKYFPDTLDGLNAMLKQADAYLLKKKLPFALILKKGIIQPYQAKKVARSLRYSSAVVSGRLSRLPKDLPSRHELLRCLLGSVPVTGSLLVATTGFAGRELYAIDDRPNNLYMVGSMGCSLSFGLGAALHLPKQKVYVLDGDGAVLMHLGALPMAGNFGKGNLVHIVFDNSSYLSTGGQKTLSGSVDLCAVARACGYKRVIFADSLAAFKKALVAAGAKGDTFIHALVDRTTIDRLPRPEIKPEEVLRRLQRHLKIKAG